MQKSYQYLFTYYTSLLFLCLIFPGLANAGKVGIGVSVSTDYRSLSLPIDVNQNYIVTPFIQQYNIEENYYFDDTAYINNFMETGVAIYRKFSLRTNNPIYGGIRLSFLATKQGNKDEDIDRLRGYRLAPTIGFRYRINSHLSINGEAEWYFLNMEGEDIDFSTGEEQHLKSQTSATSTRIIFVYHF